MITNKPIIKQNNVVINPRIFISYNFFKLDKNIIKKIVK